MSSARVAPAVLSFLLAATLSASTPAATPARSPSATPVAVPSPAGPLSGDWLFGGKGMKEPRPGPTTTERPCFTGVANLLQIRQQGDQITMGYSVPQSPHGAVFRWEPYAGEHATGTFDGERLLASGSFDSGYSPNPTVRNIDPDGAPKTKGTHEAVSYDLRLDPKSGHLVGTRNGERFWAARVTIVPPSHGCGSPPP